MKRFVIALVLAAVGLSLSIGGSILLAPSPASAQLNPAPMRPDLLRLGGGTKTATAVAGAVTLNKSSGVITSEALTTAAAATYTLTITNNLIGVGDIPFASISLGTSTTGTPEISSVTAGAGTVVIVVRNAHASAALNGTIKISFMNLKI